MAGTFSRVENAAWTAALHCNWHQWYTAMQWLSRIQPIHMNHLVLKEFAQFVCHEQATITHGSWPFCKPMCCTVSCLTSPVEILLPHSLPPMLIADIPGCFCPELLASFVLTWREGCTRPQSCLQRTASFCTSCIAVMVALVNFYTHMHIDIASSMLELHIQLASLLLFCCCCCCCCLRPIASVL
jgi:hypothetical protein